MKNRLTAISILLLALMAVPAMAKPIGPQKAEKNPHISITPEGAELLLPSGVVNEWTSDTESVVMDFVHMISASKAKIRNAFPLTLEDLIALSTSPEEALEVENMWGYVSYDVLVELLILEGYTRAQAEATASMWPQGIYVRFVNVGK